MKENTEKALKKLEKAIDVFKKTIKYLSKPKPKKGKKGKKPKNQRLSNHHHQN